MKKKIVSACVVAALAACAFGGATLAYFTDTETETNVFTVGGVDIELLESTLHRDVDKATDEQIIADAENYEEYLAEAGANLVPGEWVRKAPYVKNIGENDAYVRVKWEVSEAIDKVVNFMIYTTAQEAEAFDFQTVTGDGKVTYVFTYADPLAPGEMTYYSSFWRFQIMPGLDNEHLEALAGEGVVNNIVVTAEAIQAEGFGSAEEAFAAFDAQP